MMTLRVVAIAALVLLATGSHGRAAETPVVDVGGLTAALARAQPGDVVRLANGSFPALTIQGRSYAGTVHIAGSGSTQVAGITVSKSTNVSFENLTVKPTTKQEVRVTVKGSSLIDFSRVRFLGSSAELGVALDIARDSSQIRVTDSEFTMCQSGAPCLQPGGRSITVLRTSFHDCFDCDMVRGGGSGVTIADSSFERALRRSGKSHNDLIQIMGGGPWTLERNRFGERKFGAAQIFVGPGANNTSNPVHDVTVASSLFTGDMAHAIFVGAGQNQRTGPPQRVRIVNNTILSGHSGAIRLGEPFASLASDQRPTVANNILGVAPSGNCSRAVMVRNLVLSGKPCSGELSGVANLDASGAPTAASSTVIDAADPAYAPPRDLLGHARKGAPDIGAIEYGATAPAAPLSLTVAKKLGFRIGAIRAGGWRLKVTVGLRSGTTLTARLLQGPKTLTTKRYAVSGKTRLTFSLPLAANARKAKRLVLSLRLVGQGNRSVSRTAQVLIFH